MKTDSKSEAAKGEPGRTAVTRPVELRAEGAEANGQPKPDDVEKAGDGQADKPKAPAKKSKKLLVFGIVLLVGAIAGFAYWFSQRGFESTDDAFIDADVYQIAPRIAGRIASLPVNENQIVHKGDVLVTIDDAEFTTRRDRARAELDLAKAQQLSAEAMVAIVEASAPAAVTQADAETLAASAKLEQTRAEVSTARGEAERTAADLERYSKLSDKAVSQQRLDVVKTAKSSAEDTLRAAEKRVASADADVAAAQARAASARAGLKNIDAARADVERRKAEVRAAESALASAGLDVGYARIVAPADGRVTNKAVEPGDYVQPGRQMFSIVGAECWVVANFKETQLEHMRVGQKVRVHVDAYDVDFDGHVESIQAGSGAHFSLLPPQNATGNFVKVVQRVPVKIVFEKSTAGGDLVLGPGMSVVPTVDQR